MIYVYGKMETLKSKTNIINKHYENNKDKMNTQQSEQITCNICNSLILKCNLKRHQETQILKKNIIKNNVR